MTIRIHPRVSQNVAGDFYVEAGLCWFCTAAPNQAASLMHIPKDGTESCYFKRQPETPEELNAAINAICISEMCAVRYGGTDEPILQQLWERGQAHQCDHAPMRPPTGVVQRKRWWTELEGAQLDGAPPQPMREWLKEVDTQTRRARNSRSAQRTVRATIVSLIRKLLRRD